MNVKQFLTGMFRGVQLGSELDKIREAARADANLVVGTYLDEFSAESSRLLMETQSRMLGFDDEEVIYGEFEKPDTNGPTIDIVDYMTWSRADLLREARAIGLHVKGNSSKSDIAHALMEEKVNA